MEFADHAFPSPSSHGASAANRQSPPRARDFRPRARGTAAGRHWGNCYSATEALRKPRARADQRGISLAGPAGGATHMGAPRRETFAMIGKE
ncbi:hypothetical protein A1351_10775 [Methylosinus sp. R-45379]|nr:hypothetical protein A1351_10775 [Methylosinus sp. R-45379]